MINCNSVLNKNAIYDNIYSVDMSKLFKEKLLKIKSENNYREMKSVAGIDFSSNDYLGLAGHPQIKQSIISALNSGVDIGSSGSRLLSGNKKEHIELEEYAADYFGADSCLFFSSGFLANYAIFTTLPDRKDFIIYDELIHASVRDGIHASLAKSVKFKHNDLNSLREEVEKAQSLNAQSIWISIESVYSMDGDIADVNRILDLIKNQNNVYLVIDEAHATGIFGEGGKGFSFGIKNENIITLHTCSKGLGVSGALICASSEIVEYMINKSRPFIYTTAESPIIAVAVKEALKISSEESWRRENLLELVKYTDKNHLKTGNMTQIMPLILEDSLKSLEVASVLQAKGYNIRAIRPPTVPTARLRISLSTNRTKNEIDSLFFEINQMLGNENEKYCYSRN